MDDEILGVPLRNKHPSTSKLGLDLKHPNWKKLVNKCLSSTVMRNLGYLTLSRVAILNSRRSDDGLLLVTTQNFRSDGLLLVTPMFGGKVIPLACEIMLKPNPLHLYTPETQAGTLQTTVEKAHHYHIILCNHKKKPPGSSSRCWSFPSTLDPKARQPKMPRSPMFSTGAHRFFLDRFRGPGPLSHLSNVDTNPDDIPSHDGSMGMVYSPTFRYRIKIN